MKKRNFVAVYFNDNDNLAAAWRILIKIQKSYLVEYDVNFHVMVLLGKKKRVKKFLQKLDKKHICYAVLDLRNWRDETGRGVGRYSKRLEQLC